MRPLMPPVQTPDNLFHDGNPLTGELGTIVDAEHLNNVQGAVRDAQSELITVLTAAGINVDPSKQNQLLTALKALLLSRSTPFADIKSDGAAAIATALSNLGLKEAAKRDVGTGVGQIPDMSAFTSGPGWVRFPDGTTIQQGSAGFATGVNNQYVTLPRAFSSANFRVATVWNDVGVLQGGTAAQAAADIGLGTGSKTTTRFGLWQGGSGGFNVDWIAIGVS